MASVAEEGNRIEAATPGDHYSTLGLDINARLDEVKEVHKKLARMMHPDKAEKLIGREKANNVQAKINAAYEVLGTETRKAEYDKFRAMAFSPLYPVTVRQEFFKAYKDGQIGENGRDEWNKYYEMHLSNLRNRRM